MMIKGSIVALVTPFYEDGSVNYNVLKELIEWHILKKTDGLLLLGTTGESATLSIQEHKAIIEFAVQTAKYRIPIIAGVNSNCTQTAIMEAQCYEAIGVDYLLVITPFYNKANNAGMIQHFTHIADAVNIPIMLYNIPCRTGVSLRKEIVKVLSQHDNICGIKEASGDIHYVTDIAQYINDDFVLYIGNDDMIIASLAVGATGVVSVLANIFPDEVHDMVMNFMNGDIQQSRDTFFSFLSFIRALFIEVNPIPIKALMNYSNFQVGGYRLPLTSIEASNHEVLLAEYEHIKKLLG